MDSAFCSGFHGLKARHGADAVLLVGRLLIFVVWGIGLADAFWRVYSYGLHQYEMQALVRAKAGKAMRKKVKGYMAKYDVNRDGQ